jgi:hypothetical protein
MRFSHLVPSIRIAAAGLLFLGAALVPPASRAGMLEVADLISRPDQYDKQMVVVVGRVTSLQTAENKQGQRAYGFLLKDGNGTIKVVGLGKTDIREGEQVIVEGIFNRLRQAGRAVVYNEIKANLIRPIDRMNPDFVG